ncbi:MAG: hypothetical protein ABIA93_00680 [Candidatus Woesearchaeota archaeon]
MPKKATKKTTKTAKKAVKKVAKKRINHIRAPPEKWFVLANGEALKDVRALADALERIEDHIWAHHVQPDRNDFANWIRDVFQDMELADQLTIAKDRKHAQLVIYKHITKHLR